MSFIRSLEERKYSKGDSGLYVFPTKNPKTEEQLIEGFSENNILSEDFIEVMFRILRRARLEPSLEEVNKVREVLYLSPLNKIKDDYEVEKAYRELMDISKEEK